MANVNKTAVKSVVNEVSEALKDGGDVGFDIIADISTKDVYAVIFTPSLYESPKAPARFENTPTHKCVCTVLHDNLRQGFTFGDAHFKFNQTDLLRLIERSFA